MKRHSATKDARSHPLKALNPQQKRAIAMTAYPVIKIVRRPNIWIVSMAKRAGIALLSPIT